MSSPLRHCVFALSQATSCPPFSFGSQPLTEATKAKVTYDKTISRLRKGYAAVLHKSPKKTKPIGIFGQLKALSSPERTLKRRRISGFFTPTVPNTELPPRSPKKSLFSYSTYNPNGGDDIIKPSYNSRGRSAQINPAMPASLHLPQNESAENMEIVTDSTLIQESAHPAVMNESFPIEEDTAEIKHDDSSLMPLPKARDSHSTTLYHPLDQYERAAVMALYAGHLRARDQGTAKAIEEAWLQRHHPIDPSIPEFDEAAEPIFTNPPIVVRMRKVLSAKNKAWKQRLRELGKVFKQNRFDRNRKMLQELAASMSKEQKNLEAEKDKARKRAQEKVEIEVAEQYTKAFRKARRRYYEGIEDDFDMPNPKDLLAKWDIPSSKLILLKMFNRRWTKMKKRLRREERRLAKKRGKVEKEAKALAKADGSEKELVSEDMQYIAQGAANSDSTELGSSTSIHQASSLDNHSVVTTNNRVYRGRQSPVSWHASSFVPFPSGFDLNDYSIINTARVAIPTFKEAESTLDKARRLDELIISLMEPVNPILVREDPFLRRSSVEEVTHDSPTTSPRNLLSPISVPEITTPSTTSEAAHTPRKLKATNKDVLTPPSSPTGSVTWRARKSPWKPPTPPSSPPQCPRPDGSMGDLDADERWSDNASPQVEADFLEVPISVRAPPSPPVTPPRSTTILDDNDGESKTCFKKDPLPTSHIGRGKLSSRFKTCLVTHGLKCQKDSYVGIVFAQVSPSRTRLEQLSKKRRRSYNDEQLEASLVQQKRQKWTNDYDGFGFLPELHLINGHCKNGERVHRAFPELSEHHPDQALNTLNERIPNDHPTQPALAWRQHFRAIFGVSFTTSFSPQDADHHMLRKKRKLIENGENPADSTPSHRRPKIDIQPDEPVLSSEQGTTKPNCYATSPISPDYLRAGSFFSLPSASLLSSTLVNVPKSLIRSVQVQEGITPPNFEPSKEVNDEMMALMSPSRFQLTPLTMLSSSAKARKEPRIPTKLYKITCHTSRHIPTKFDDEVTISPSVVRALFSGPNCRALTETGVEEIMGEHLPTLKCPNDRLGEKDSGRKLQLTFLELKPGLEMQDEPIKLAPDCSISDTDSPNIPHDAATTKYCSKSQASLTHSFRKAAIKIFDITMQNRRKLRKPEAVKYDERSGDHWSGFMRWAIGQARLIVPKEKPQRLNRNQRDNKIGRRTGTMISSFPLTKESCMKGPDEVSIPSIMNTTTPEKLASPIHNIPRTVFQEKNRVEQELGKREVKFDELSLSGFLAVIRKGASRSLCRFLQNGETRTRNRSKKMSGSCTPRQEPLNNKHQGSSPISRLPVDLSEIVCDNSPKVAWALSPNQRAIALHALTLSVARNLVKSYGFYACSDYQGKVWVRHGRKRIVPHKGYDMEKHLHFNIDVTSSWVVKISNLALQESNLFHINYPQPSLTHIIAKFEGVVPESVTHNHIPTYAITPDLLVTKRKRTTGWTIFRVWFEEHSWDWMVSKIEQEHIGRLLYIHEQHNPVWEAIARLWEYCSQHRLGGCENFKAFVMAEVERYGVLNGPQSLIKQQTGITLIAKGFKDAKLQ